MTEISEAQSQLFKNKQYTNNTPLCHNHHQSRKPASFNPCIRSNTPSIFQMSPISPGIVMFLRSTFRQSNIACLSSPSTSHLSQRRSCLGFLDQRPVSIGRIWLPRRKRMASLLSGCGFAMNGDCSSFGFICV